MVIESFLQQIEDDLGLSIDSDFRSRGSPTHLLGVLSGMEFNNQPHIIIDRGGSSNWFWVMVKSHVL